MGFSFFSLLNDQREEIAKIRQQKSFYFMMKEAVGKSGADFVSSCRKRYRTVPVVKLPLPHPPG
jgi:hypothetical protein